MPIAANLRHDQLDEVVTEASLTGEAVADYPFAAELAFCFRLARALKARREVVRGKPELFNRPDYNFRLERDDDETEPDGNERGADQHAPARRAAGPDRQRGHDPGQQHLGRLAGRARRARHLPQPGQHGCRA